MADTHNAADSRAAILRATIMLYRFAAANHRAWQRWYEKPTIYSDDVAKRLARKYRNEARRCEDKSARTRGDPMNRVQRETIIYRVDADGQAVAPPLNPTVDGTITIPESGMYHVSLGCEHEWRDAGHVGVGTTRSICLKCGKVLVIT